MNTIQRIEVTTQNLNHIDFGGVVALTVAAEGAMGEPGCVEFSTAEGTLYHFNYVYGGLTLSQLYKAFPACPINPSHSLDCWHEFYLGVGNSLYLHEKAYEKYQKNSRSNDPEDIMLWWRSTLGEPLFTKEERYAWLVSEAKASYPQTSSGQANELVWYDACRDEINLWTYWQGQGCFNPEILVVGQDWGNPDTAEGRRCLDAIKRGTPYLLSSTFPSDKNLATLFKTVWNIDIGQKNEKLFFTNLVLGYRTGKNTGPLKAAQFVHDLGYFKTLVHILHPRIAICLGQNTFTYALRAYGEKVDFPDGYASALDSRGNYIDLEGTRFYGMAHCGNYGCKNRGGNVAKGLALQIQDWMEMRA